MLENAAFLWRFAVSRVSRPKKRASHLGARAAPDAMELQDVPEIGVGFARTLQDAGVESAEALAAWDDLEGLAARSGVSLERLESFRDAARARMESILAQAGVADPAELAAASLDDLQGATGIAEAHLRRYQDAARAHVRKLLVDAGYGDARALSEMDVDVAAAQTGIAARHLVAYRDVAIAEIAAGPDRVVLLDGAPLARVRAAGVTHEAIPLVTLGASDDEAEVFSRANGPAVLLRADADTAPALVGGVTHRLPLFKERRVEDRVEEVRVRVVEIRERAAAPVEEKRKSGIGRLFSRKK